MNIPKIGQRWIKFDICHNLIEEITSINDDGVCITKAVQLIKNRSMCSLIEKQIVGSEYFI